MARICVVTSIHADFDSRIYKHCLSVRRLGHEVALISPWPPRHDDGICYLSFPRRRGLGGRARQAADIARLALRAGADLFHFHDVDILPLFVLLRLVTRRPVVYDIHENYSEEMLVRYWVPSYLRIPLYHAVRLAQAFGCSVFRNLVVVVNSIEREYGRPWLRCVQVRNYASVALADQAADDYERRENAVLFTGSQYVENGALLFLDIAQRVLARRRDIRFYSINRFGMRKDSHEKAMRLMASERLRGKVQVLPRIHGDRIMEYINRATIGISPNLNVPKQVKAIPTKLFEYMAGGLPIVASDLPYNREFVRETGAGLLADPSDPERFADHICWLADHRREAQQMGRRGRQAYLDRLNWEKQDQVLGGFYEAILARHPHGLHAD